MFKNIVVFSLLLLIIGFAGLIIGYKYLINEYDERITNTLLEPRAHISTDGPYILYHHDSIQTIYVGNKKGSYVINKLKTSTDRFDRNLQVDIFTHGQKRKKNFNVTIEDSLEAAPSKYPMPQKIMAISNIEGNFYILQKLLCANGVIDDDYNWSFEKGHLVLMGDFVHRGLNVTQCLWLCYKLEQQAKAAGGMVHFLLGNHEVMNMYGDLVHVRSKYKLLADKLGMDYSRDILGHNSELGRWLRKKNVAEKIGSYLFVHGGISHKIVDLKISIDSLNKFARQHYGKDYGLVRKDPTAGLIFGKWGPLWYRGYMRNPKNVVLSEVRSIQNAFKVDRIIIGHTEVAAVKSVHSRDIVNINVHYPRYNQPDLRGYALWIENKVFYVIDDLGQRFELKEAL